MKSSTPQNTLFFILFFMVLFSTNSIAQEKAPNDCSIQEIDSLLQYFKKEKTYDKILPYAEIGLVKSAKEYGKQDTTYAKMLYFMGLYYHLFQDAPTAINYYEEAITIQKEKMPISPQYGNTANNLGALYQVIGKLELAISMHQEALHCRKKAFGDKHPDVATSSMNLAIVYYYLNQFSKSELLYKEALKIRKEALGNQHPSYAEVVSNLAVLYMVTEKYELAEPLYKESIKIRKEQLGEQHRDYAASLNNLGILYYNMGDYLLAEPLYKEAMLIQKKLGDDVAIEYAGSLNNLAGLYKNLDDNSSAESLYKECLELRKQLLGTSSIEYAGVLNNLAILYNKMGEYELALPLLKEALLICEKTAGKNHTQYASSLYNLADLYKDMKQYELAIPLYKEAMAIWRKSLGDKTAYYPICLNYLAVSYKDMGNYEMAQQCIQEALIANSGTTISLSISEAWLDSLLQCNYISTIEMGNTLQILYYLLARQQYPNYKSKQVIVSNLALMLLQKNRQDFLNEGDKLRTLSKNSDWVLRSLSVLDPDKQAAQAFVFAEQSKSVLLLDAAQATRAESFGNLPDSLVQKEKKLQEEKGSYEAGILENRPEFERDSLRNLLNKLNLEIKDFKKEIDDSYPQYAALKYQSNAINVPEIQQLLDGHTALLEYVIGDSVVYVFYMDKQNSSLTPIYLDNDLLTQKINTFHQILSNYALAQKKGTISYQKYTQHAFWFYENLVAPVLKNNTNIQKLILVPDGELGYLPFEAFLTKPAPQKETDYQNLNYLINDYAISYNYSASLWKSSKEVIKRPNNGQILALASNYDIKIDPKKEDWRLPIHQRLRSVLKPLPAARKEVETLMEEFAGFLGVDNLASEKVFKEKAGDYAVIHLAMHGLLDPKEPILSSLAFTEDGDSLENNFLQAYEISKMKLNADLVVLSACETGFGRFEKGNGIASLAQAFAYAGAPSMIVSLWQVNDYATSEIMKNLYQNLANGMEKDAALQQAKLQYIKTAKGILAHPAFWSPFIQMGNTDAIYLEKKAGWTWWIIGLSIVAFSLIIGLYFFKKRQEV